MLGLQHIDMPNLRGRSEEGEEGNEVRKADSDDEFNFGPTEEVGMSNQAKEVMDVWTDGRRSSNRRIARCRGRPEPTEPRGRKAVKGKNGGIVEEDKADRVKTKTKTWADVVKGLEVDESETTDSINTRSELELANAIEMFDLEEPDR